MSIKNREILGFFLTTSLLLTAGTWQAVKAQKLPKINCSSKLSSGTTYRVRQQPEFQQTGTALSGEVKFIQIHKCAKGTCFQAKMNIDNYDISAKKIEGYWQDSNIQFIRYVGQENTPEIWSGQCQQNSLRGEWYFPNNSKNGHLFIIDY